MPATIQPPRVLAEGFACAESPRWHDGELYFSDMYGRAVMAVAPDGRSRLVAEVPEVPTGLGWLPDGRLLIATQRGRRVRRLEPDGTLAVHADLRGAAVSDLNDMWVDASGRAYVGELGFDAEALLADLLAEYPTRDEAVSHLMERVRERPGRIHLVRPDGTHQIADDATILPNGLAVSPDGRRLYVNASLEPAVRRFDIAPDGTLSGGAVVARPDLPPDGMSAMDADGGFWIADPEGHVARRVAADGRVTDRVATDRKCLAVALGGPAGNSLFLCTTISNDERESVRQRASRVEVTDVPVRAAIATAPLPRNFPCRAKSGHIRPDSFFEP